MTDPVVVTDHAIVRYLERVLQVDVAQLRAMIAEGCARHQGAPCVKTLGARFLMVDGRVVTVIAGDVIPGRDVLVRLVQQNEAER